MTHVFLCSKEKGTNYFILFLFIIYYIYCVTVVVKCFFPPQNQDLSNLQLKLLQCVYSVNRLQNVFLQIKIYVNVILRSRIPKLYPPLRISIYVCYIHG